MIETLASSAIGSLVLLALVSSLLAAHGRDVAIDAVEIAIEADPRLCPECSRRGARLPFLLAVLLGATSLVVSFATLARGRRPEPMALQLARFIVRTEAPGIAVVHAPGAVTHGDDDEAAKR